MKKSCLFAVSALLLLLGGCYGDKGNYDYREINEIVIGARASRVWNTNCVRASTN